MSFELSLRLYLKHPEMLAPKAGQEKMFEPKIDKQAGKMYLQFGGQDAFAVAKLVPPELVKLVTLRQYISRTELPSARFFFDARPGSQIPGFYTHDEVSIIAEDDGEFHFNVTATGTDISEIEVAYGLFRAGQLDCTPWT